MPGDAVYCPSCGAVTGALRVEPLSADADAPAADVALGAPRRRWLPPVVIAAVIALIAVVVIRGGGDKPAAAPTTSSTSPTTTAASTTTTTVARATTTTTNYSTAQATPVPEAAGVVVYISTNAGEIVRLDLGTGAVVRRLVPVASRRRGPWMVLARQGGYAVADVSYNDQSPIYGVADGSDSAPVVLGDWQTSDQNGPVNPRSMAAAEPGEVWVWNDAVGDVAGVVKRVRLDGTVTAGPVTLPRYAAVLGDDGPGSVAVQGPSGFYHATIDGTTVTLQQLWPRPAVIYSSGAFLDLNCDGQLECRLEVVDRVSGAVHVVPGDLAGDLFPNYYDSTLSVDGRWLANVIYDAGGGSPRLRVYDLTTGAIVMEDDVLPKSYGPLGMPHSAEYSPDGQWLIYLDLGGELRLWRVGSPDDPRSVPVPAPPSNVSSVSVGP